MEKESHSAANRRIAKNTLILYVRMLFMMAVSLYTSRVVLNALGVEDYGIYNVVGSIVAMFHILSGSLSSAIGRFLTFELGRGDKTRLNRVFCTSIIVQVILAVIIIIAIESIGLWFANNKLQIPPERLNAAIWVIHLSVITFAIGLISVPYNALVIAHERMAAFAYISIIEATLKLLIAIWVTYTLYDKLIFYATLMALVAVAMRIIYGVYSRRNFEEARFHLIFDKSLLQEMFGFAGWNFIGVSSVVLRDQGSNIILNIFCGPVVNAARGIALQVHAAVSQFVSNFQTAFNPQITKSFAAGDRAFMHSLIMRGARFSSYLIILLSLPLLLETEFVLKIWLKIVPDHAANFTRLMLLFALSEALAKPIVTGMLASGDIKKFQLIAGSIQLLNLPLAYLALLWGFRPEGVFFIALLVSHIALFAKLVLVKPLIGLGVKAFIVDVYLNVVKVLAIAIIPPMIVYTTMEGGWLRFLVCATVSVFSAITAIYFFGCSTHERELVSQKVKSMTNRISKH